MIENIIEKIRKFVEEECKKNDHGFCKEWIVHLNAVVENALEMASKSNVDLEIVELAAWLHDIGTIVNNRKEDHHITGAEIAEGKLRELNYSEEKIKKIKHCIFSHRASQQIKREIPEAIILADADSMSHFGEFENLVKAEVVLGGEVNKEWAKEKVREKFIRSWKRFSPEGMLFAQKKYSRLNKSLSLK